MRVLICASCLAFAVAASARAQTAATSPPPTTQATAPELIEDLRLLSLINSLEPTRDQTQRLTAAAEFGRDELKKIQAEAVGKVEQLHDSLATARRKLLLGADVESATSHRLAQTTRAAETVRVQKIEALIVTLTERVRKILTREQAARIESDLAPTGDQPWRRYGQALGSPSGGRSGSRMPSDPGKWLGELRDLRIDSAEGDPAHEVDDFAKKMTRGLRAGTPLSDQLAAQSKVFAAQVLAMPENAFRQREWELARTVSRQELEARNQQRLQEGKTIEQFDPYRWLVEEVLLSPRAAPVLKERSALNH